MIFELLEDFATALRAAPAGWAESGPGEFYRFLRSRQDLLAAHADLISHWAINQHAFPVVQQRALQHHESFAAKRPFLRGLTRSPTERRLLTIVAHQVAANGENEANIRSRSLIWDCKWSPTGTHIASATKTTVRLWDALTGRLYGEMPGRRWCAFSPDGRKLIAPDGPMIRVMDAVSGSESAPLCAPSKITSCLFCPRTGAVIGLGDSGIHLWRGGQYSCPASIDGTPSLACAISADGYRLAASVNQLMRMWDTNTWQQIAVSKSFPISIIGCDFSPNGKTLYVSGMVNEFRGMTWALDGETLVKIRQFGEEPKWEKMEMASKPTVRCAASPDGTALAVATEMGGHIEVWESENGHLIDKLPVGARTWACHYSPDGKELVSGDWNGHLIVWDMRLTSQSPRIRLPVGSLLDLKVWGKWLATITASFVHRTGHGEVLLWDLENGSASRVTSLPFLGAYGHLDVSGNVQISRAGVSAGVSGSGWAGYGDCKTVPLPASPADPHRGVDDRDFAVTDRVPDKAASGRYTELSPDGRLGLYLAEESLVVEDIRSETRLLEVPHIADRVRGLTFSPNGRLVLVAGSHTVEIWSLDGRVPILKTASRARLAACAWGFAGTRLIAADALGAVEIFVLENLSSRPIVTAGLAPTSPELAWTKTLKTWARRVFRRQYSPDGPRAFFRCPWAERPQLVQRPVLEAILEISDGVALSSDESAAIQLPDTAFDDLRLQSDCPACNRPIQFNPFLAAQIPRPRALRP